MFVDPVLVPQLASQGVLKLLASDGAVYDLDFDSILQATDGLVTSTCVVVRDAAKRPALLQCRDSTTRVALYRSMLALSTSFFVIGRHPRQHICPSTHYPRLSLLVDHLELLAGQLALSPLLAHMASQLIAAADNPQSQTSHIARLYSALMLVSISFAVGPSLGPDPTAHAAADVNDADDLDDDWAHDAGLEASIDDPFSAEFPSLYGISLPGSQ